MKARSGAMTVGNVAKRAEVKIDTIRFYERQGLLPKPPRTPAGYRTFDETTVQRLRFIRNAQALGFTLKEIKQLFSLRITVDSTCSDIRDYAESKVADIERKIESLQAMKRALQDLVSACTVNGPVSECLVFEGLNTYGKEYWLRKQDMKPFPTCSDSETML
jgi:MerR family mercuric resistance operon transcriptional regulator